MITRTKQPKLPLVKKGDKMNDMPPTKELPTNKRLFALRNASGLTQTEFAKKFFCAKLRAYQRWEATENHAELPGPVRVIIEALERGGELPS